MPDNHTSQQRHNNMAAIHSKDTKPEMVVRRYLWNHGFRYRLNHSRLPGKPDIVLRKYRTCIFVNGCFWHGHNVAITETTADAVIDNSECCKIPKSNRSFWLKKIPPPPERDREVQQKLAMMGWHCVTVWECQLSPKQREQTLASLAYTLNGIYLDDHTVSHYIIPDDDGLMVAEDDATDYNK